MTTKKYNFPPELLTAIEKENLIIFVGAGLSYSLKNTQNQEIGNWNNLVLQILKSLRNDDTDILIPLVGKFDPVDILDLLEKNKSINIGNVKDFTKSFFDLNLENDLSLHEKIFKLTNQIITTNYDCAFEEANPILRKNIAHTGNKHELVNFTKSNVPTLFKLHGTYERSDSMILFSSDYNALYTNPDNDAELTLLTLRNTILNKTVLFVGCSMSDFQINELFQYIKKLKGIYNQKHFIITKDTLDSSLDFLEAITIEDHDEIPILIKELLNKKEEFTDQKKLVQDILEHGLEDLEQDRIDLEEKLKEALSDSDRKEALLKREALKYLKKGDNLREQQEYEKANQEYKVSIELNPIAEAYNKWAISLKNLAENKQDQNLLIKAIEKYKMATEIKPDAFYLYLNWGNSLISLSKINKNENLLLHALEKFKKALTYDSEKRDHIKYTLSKLARLIKLTSDRRKMFEIAKVYMDNTENDKGNLSKSMSLGYFLTEIAMLEKDEDLCLKALKEFKKQTRLNSKNDTNYSDWGFALMTYYGIKNDTKLLKKACKKFEKAVELNDSLYYTYTHWGQALFRLGIKNNDLNYYYMATDKFEKAIELNPLEYSSYHSSAYTLNLLGSLKKDEGKFEKAYKLYGKSNELYKKAYKLNVKNYILLRHWGNNLQMQGDLKSELNLYEEALIKFEKALDIKEDDYYTLTGRISVLLDLSRLRKDIDLYKKTEEECEKFIKAYSKYELAYNKYISFRAQISELEHYLSHSY